MIGPYNEKFIHLKVEPTEPELFITREVLAQMRSHKLKVCHCIRNLQLFFKVLLHFFTGYIWLLAYRWFTQCKECVL